MTERRAAILAALDEGVDHIECQGWAEGDECVCPAHVWLESLRDLVRAEFGPRPAHQAQTTVDLLSAVVHIAPDAWDDQGRLRVPSRGKLVWGGKAYTVDAGDQLELARNGTVSLNGVVAEGEDHDG